MPPQLAFEPAVNYAGPRVGMIYTTRDGKTGYYADAAAQLSHMVQGDSSPEAIPDPEATPDSPLPNVSNIYDVYNTLYKAMLNKSIGPHSHLFKQFIDMKVLDWVPEPGARTILFHCIYCSEYFEFLGVAARLIRNGACLKPGGGFAMTATEAATYSNWKHIQPQDWSFDKMSLYEYVEFKFGGTWSKDHKTAGGSYILCWGDMIRVASGISRFGLNKFTDKYFSDDELVDEYDRWSRSVIERDLERDPSLGWKQLRLREEHDWDIQWSTSNWDDWWPDSSYDATAAATSTSKCPHINVIFLNVISLNVISFSLLFFGLMAAGFHLPPSPILLGQALLVHLGSFF